MQFLLPDFVKTVIKTIENTGGEAYIVGGCVRDILLNKIPDDFDVTTSLSPEEIIPLFKKTVPTGIKHGTVTVIIDSNQIEVTTFRSDGEYSDSRHPNEVSFVKNLKEDLARRDFTVNSLAYNEKVGIVDKFGGIDDLNNKVLRAVGEPTKRFNEDALRIMRLFRFSSQLNFNIDNATFDAAIKMSPLLSNISRERIATELFKAILSDYPQRINPLIKSGALEFCGIRKTAVSDNLAKLPKERNLRFFAFLNENGGDISTVCQNLKTDKALLKFCLAAKEIKPPFDTISVKTALSQYNEDTVKASIILNGGDPSVIENIKQDNEPYKISHLAINGDDLKAANIEEKKIGLILNLLLQEVIKKPELNKKEILLKISRNQ